MRFDVLKEVICKTEVFWGVEMPGRTCSPHLPDVTSHKTTILTKHKSKALHTSGCKQLQKLYNNSSSLTLKLQHFKPTVSVYNLFSFFLSFFWGGGWC
jgi:hypothetical protein